MAKKILITGSNGMLGKELVEKLSLDKTLEVIGVDLQDFDITNQIETQKFIKNINPDFIIHGAAYTNVDRAEQEPDKCFLINETGTAIVAEAAKEVGAVLCYISTDFVFDGTKGVPYLEEDSVRPINVYGHSKQKGEQAVISITDKYFILRIAWLYGKHGKNFIDTIIKLAKEKDVLNIVNDQIGTPTYAEDIAENIMDVLQTEAYGIYNFTGRGQCSWFDFAKKALEIKNINTPIMSILSQELERAAERPKYSVLDLSKVDDLLGREVMPRWEDSLVKYLK